MGLNVIVMGAPGAGKGTQAARLAAVRCVPTISTGDILREGVKAGDRVALEAKSRMDAGELVDDATMIKIIRDRLWRPDTDPGFVLDGFPRTVGQARAFDELMAERNNGPLIIVDIVVPEAELVRRLASRRICERCGTNAPQSAPASAACEKCGGRMVQRTDDNTAVVLERLSVYRRSTEPVVEFYRDRAAFRVVNGAQPQEHVARELDAAVNEAFAESSRR
jgi:adenylate kinase